MLYKMDNTMFGGNPPPLPQWTGAPRGIIQVQAMLYASLAASLFSAFLAMLGKQWLNRYASTDMRGTAVERSRDRQRKLDGIITWYFDHVMESLPLMLQSALLLLGCALSIYLWEIHVTVACVVVSVTVLGVIFFVFFVIAGAASTSCPYQTPGGRALRHIYRHTLHHIYHHTLPNILRSTPSLLYSAFRRLVFSSMFIGLFRRWASEESPYNGLNIIIWISSIPFIPFVLIHDFCHFILVVVKAPIVLAYGMLSRILNRSSHPAQTHTSNQPMAILDSRCISWILQTSLERGVRLSTLKFLATIPTLVDLDPALVLECFNVLIDCVKVNEGSPAVVQGMEQLGEASAMSFFLTYSHLTAMDPTSSILASVVQRYERIFPPHLTSGNLPFPHTLGIIHEAIHPGWELRTSIDWTDYESTNHEHVVVSRALLKLCRFKCKDPRREYDIVPLQFHHFAAHFLTQNSLPSSSIVADCLLILATELHCNVPETMISEERYVYTWQKFTTLLSNSQCTTRGGFRPDNPETQYCYRTPKATFRPKVRTYWCILLVCNSARATWRSKIFRCSPSFREGKFQQTSHIHILPALHGTGTVRLRESSGYNIRYTPPVFGAGTTLTRPRTDPQVGGSCLCSSAHRGGCWERGRCLAANRG